MNSFGRGRRTRRAQEAYVAGFIRAGYLYNERGDGVSGDEARDAWRDWAGIPAPRRKPLSSEGARHHPGPHAYATHFDGSPIGSFEAEAREVTAWLREQGIIGPS